jgi:hypothetical protein
LTFFEILFDFCVHDSLVLLFVKHGRIKTLADIFVVIF